MKLSMATLLRSNWVHYVSPLSLWINYYVIKFVDTNLELPSQLRGRAAREDRAPPASRLVPRTFRAPHSQVFRLLQQAPPVPRQTCSSCIQAPEGHLLKCVNVSHFSRQSLSWQPVNIPGGQGVCIEGLLSDRIRPSTCCCCRRRHSMPLTGTGCIRQVAVGERCHGAAPSSRPRASRLHELSQRMRVAQPAHCVSSTIGEYSRALEVGDWRAYGGVEPRAAPAVHWKLDTHRQASNVDEDDAEALQPLQSGRPRRREHRWIRRYNWFQAQQWTKGTSSKQYSSLIQNL